MKVQGNAIDIMQPVDTSDCKYHAILVMPDGSEHEVMLDEMGASLDKPICLHIRGLGAYFYRVVENDRQGDGRVKVERMEFDFTMAVKCRKA